MASSSSTKLVLFPCLFLTCLFLSTFSNNLVVAKESDKVKLNLYYESLCPACQEFIVDGLVKIFDSDLYTITTLKLVPFGNAKLSNNQTVTCQHGERECKLNALEACVIKAIPDPKLHYKVIRCVEEGKNEWSCVKDSGSDKAIKNCYNSDLSKKLILGYAKETMSLKPKHEYVPWITVNGEPVDMQKIGNWMAKICEAYKGKALPKFCSSSTLSERKVTKLQVSYVDEAKNY